MSPSERVAIVGLGLMGGSLARALARLDVRVLGYDSTRESLDAAVGEGVVHERLGADLEGIERADVVVFATPVDATLALLPRVARRLAHARLVMDLASTKQSIIRAAEDAAIGARYVGAHPLAGSHRSGWPASQASLFDGARTVLCPTRSTTPDALQAASTFWRRLSACVQVLDAAAHDEQMAWCSHLPHLLSAALAVTLREAGVERSALGPGGRDMTRLAGSSPTLWTSIVDDNSAALAGALEALEVQLHRIRDTVTRRDRRATQDFLATAFRYCSTTMEAPSTFPEPESSTGNS